MNVLIATPTYANLLRPETAEAARRLGGEWKVYEHNPYPAPDGRNVTAAYQRIREDFLAGSWDALLTLEHDMIPPDDALMRLWATEAPVAYGVYLLRHGALVLNTCQWVPGMRNMGESLSLRKGPTDGVQRVSGVGFGCTLMRREVVERFPFHDGGDPGQSPDIPFAVDCIRGGVEQVADFDVLCGHWEGGRILRPWVDGMESTMRLRMAATINATVERQNVRLVAGQEYDIPAATADDLLRAGYAVQVSNAGSGDTDAPKAGSTPAKSGKRKGTARVARPRDTD